MPKPLTAEQKIASHPEHSVWVNANAGTGKTKVLTDRVLRLLLEGTPPNKILCITFTNAAAAEMSNRILETLSRWVMLGDESLKKELIMLIDRPPNHSLLVSARNLFSTIMDNPKELKIQTIHSFCQALLKRFPLEANIPPHFDVMDQQTSNELMKEAWLKLLSNQSKETALRQAISTIAKTTSDSVFHKAIRELLTDRTKFAWLLQTHGDIEQINKEIYKTCNIEQAKDEEDYFAETLDNDTLEELADILKEGSNRDKKYEERIRQFAQLDSLEQIENFRSISTIFLSDSDLAKELKLVITKPILTSFPHAREIVHDIQSSFIQLHETLQSLHTARLTVSFMTVAEALFEHYDYLKQAHAKLDFNDLIITTEKLLSEPDKAAWIIFKLDEGIDHILIDEAQDTSPEQWRIIAALCDEFFSGEGQRDENRSVFAVGDEKQSIFSFQGADLTSFQYMHQYFERRAQNANKSWQPVSLDTSFRSTDPILRLVDEIFREEHSSNAVTTAQNISHKLHRIGHAGRIALHALVTEDEKEPREPWQLPTERRDYISPRQKVAEQIANTIDDWMKNRRLLPSKGRPIRPEDIMILVRRRDQFVPNMIKALQDKAIPVAGADRLILTEHLAVMDLIALAQILLLPSDDLTLACVLKSPLINMNEEALYSIAYNRGDLSLWQSMASHKNEDPTCKAAWDYLAKLRQISQTRLPFEFYMEVLETMEGRKAFISCFGQEVNDPIDEFLDRALHYEKQHAPTLQGFVHWLTSGTTEIKRDLEYGDNQVRIMTVHGAKGLQAPIVFLPDTTQIPKNNTQLLWSSDADSLVFWPGRKENHNRFTKRLAAEKKHKQSAEYLRLLYVALTRAEDELYIYGWQQYRDIADDCWYALIKKAMTEIATKSQDGCYYLDSKQNVAAEPSSNDNKEPPQTILPKFLTISAPREEEAFEKIRPSGAKHAIKETSTASIARGTLMHKLLEILPNIKDSERLAVGEKILHRAAPELTLSEKNAMLTEVTAVLNHDTYKKLFGSESQAEVPLSGIINNQVISGQIDRLLVTDKEVIIVDYKTNKHPPKQVKQVQTQYIEQLRSYKFLLEDIYPDKTVRCALLWTSTLTLMFIDNRLLQQASLDLEPIAS